MVSGYNEPRPKKWNYDCFKYGFLKALRALNIEGLSLMFYGSYVRGDAIFGRSDIDALLIFPDDVIIDKERFMQVSEAFRKSQKGNNVPFQVTVSDLRTLKDGRFNTYAPNFKNYFSEEGEVVFGTDYRAEFKYELPTHSEQNALAFNLRKSRQALLFSNWDIEEDYKKFLERLNKVLDSASRGSKQVLSMVDGILRKNRFSGIGGLESVFPELDLSTLREIKRLYTNLDELDGVYHNQSQAQQLMIDSVDFFERLIKCYLDRNTSPRQ